MGKQKRKRDEAIDATLFESTTNLNNQTPLNFKLPDGWVVEEIPRPSKPSKLDKLYYEPGSKRKFRSLPDVQRYLTKRTKDYVTTERMILENKDTSESLECPSPPKKHLSSSSMMISCRHASMRSPKRLAGIENTSVPSSSQPQTSREHCSATKDFQQPDDPVDTVISAIQVQAGSVIESPSRLLTQVAHPSTFTPEMRHEETGKVVNLVATEKCTVDIPEMVEAHEAELVSNHSNQMEWQKTVLEVLPLAMEFQVSNTLEERENMNLSKSSSMFGPPPSSFSFNLTEIVKMLDDEDEEVNSVRQSSSMDTVEGYQVKPNFVPILRKVLIKHGDIAKNCTVLTVKYRSKLLEMICEIISELQEKEFSKIKDDDLRETIALVNEIKNMKVDIEWLHLRLVEILDARQFLKQSSMLKKEKDSNRKVIETAEKELEECEEQKKEMEAKIRSICDKETICKESLARAKADSTKIWVKIKDARSKVKPFLNCSLVDDLV